MPSINLLSREISELIAAGEVIERPSSVIKELIENSIDAESRHIVVEIKNGGSTFIRITDDGCGISGEDVPKAFLRHATSKITTADDLAGILTLGFRGEALASVCAVSKTEMMTKQRDDEYGTHYIIEGSEEKLMEKSGCPDGTTLIIRDLFYNVPARQKFMKKDVAEGNAVCNIVNKIALSHPEISFKMIRDNKPELRTAGDGKLLSAVYAVYGKDFAHDMLEVDYEQNGIRVSGFTIKPLYSKANRTFQNFFVNNRYIKSQVCAAAVEEAYKGLIMVGKFPACVLKIEMSPDIVDVNVHPAKVEVRFSDDKPIYECVYFAVKSALMKAGLIYDFQLKNTPVQTVSSEKYEQPALPVENSIPLAAEEKKIPENIFIRPENNYSEASKNSSKTDPDTQPVRTERSLNMSNESRMTVSISQKTDPVYRQTAEPAIKTKEVTAPVPVPAQTVPSAQEKVKYPEPAAVSPEPVKKPEPLKRNDPDGSNDEESSSFSYINTDSLKRKKPEPEPVAPVQVREEKPVIRYIGEAFSGYVIAEVNDKIIIMDKHAAHERMIFERLKAEQKDPASQLILCPEGILLSLDEADALADNAEILTDMGFEIDFSGSPYVYVKAVPTIISHLDMSELIPEVAENFRKNKIDPKPDAIDDILHSIACKAAIKMNDKNSETELHRLICDVYENEKIRHCPHGRPVLFTISKYDLEKQFRRRV